LNPRRLHCIIRIAIVQHSINYEDVFIIYEYNRKYALDEGA
jgi:hypothetical protein